MASCSEDPGISEEPLEADGGISGVAVGPQCGYSWWKPACLRRLARPSVFLFVMCLFVGSDGLNVGIITGTITSVEARFQFTLTELGSMQTSFCVGGITGLLLSMYFGGKAGSNRPRLLGICGIFCGLGMASQSIPQFMQGPYVPVSFSHGNLPNGSNATTHTCTTVAEACEGDLSAHGPPSNRAAYWVFVFGAVLQGMSVFGVYPIGVAYIADCTSQGTTSLYIGIINAVLGLGPVAGVMLAAAFIGVWVDFYRLEEGTELGLGPEDPEWIGAWWLGYLVVGFLYIFAAAHFLLFPRHMPSRNQPKNYLEMEKMEVGEGDEDKRGYGTKDHRFSTAKEFVLAVWKTLKNPYCSLTCLSQSTFYFIMYGYGVFVPKYLEVQFGYERQVADLFTGVLLAPAYAFGELFAGFVVKKLDMKLRGIIRLTCGVLTACVVGMILLMFVGCGNDRVVGVFSSYDGLGSSLSCRCLLPPESSRGRCVRFGYQRCSQPIVGVEAPCNQNCSCSMAVYAPVCNEEGLTYFSPCHAGCKGLGSNDSFSDCACLMSASASNSTDSVASTSVVEGACGTQCKAAVPFLIILTAVFVLATFSDLLRLTIIVRSATSENRLVALCLAYLTQVIGIVPAGLIFGSLIDSTCMEWQQSCEGQGACLLYDNDAYRLAYNGLAMAVAVFSAGTMFAVLWWPKGKFSSLMEANANESKTADEKEITS